MKIIDFYSGFEGEPEYIIISRAKDETLVSIHIWSGYFDQVLRLIPVESDGNWAGITLHYHLVTGWFDKPWTCDDIQLLIKQLDQVEEDLLDAEAREVLLALKKISSTTSEHGGQLTIEYD